MLKQNEMVETMKLCVWLLFITTLCECISEDYFLYKEKQNTPNLNKNESVSKPIQEEQLLFKAMLRSNTSESSIAHVTAFTKRSLINNYDDYRDSATNENIGNMIVGKRIFGTDYVDNSDTYDGLLEKGPSVSKANIYLDILKDYVYQYNEPVTVRQILRQQKDKFKNDLLKSNKTTETNISKSDYVTSEKLVVDFYNLQPATPPNETENEETGKLGYYYDIQKYVNDSVWYVPENLPCWDLPILYAELGQKKKEGVFLTYGGSLKNVVEKYEAEKLANKKFNIPISQILNKWCASDPCYGDHTLCLFSDSTNSKLCVSGYEVLSPSMGERIALVNTVNSMRNRIATGVTDLYKHLPTATDMNQLIYDFDLQTMAEAWLRQCLPGPSTCSSLEGNYVAQLECTKYTDLCCTKSYKTVVGSKCIPHRECFIDPLIGCIHSWFRSGVELTATDIDCGHITPTTYNTVQLIWAETNKIGCAYGKSPWGDVRVVCTFAPGAPFTIYTKSFCGFILHKEMMEVQNGKNSIPHYLSSLGIHLHKIQTPTSDNEQTNHKLYNDSLRFSDIDTLSKIYTRRWVRKQLQEFSNGTLGLTARLVTKYTFGGDNGPQCDTSKHIYEIGEPGSLCVEKGRRFNGLCYDFRDPTPGYRAVSVLAPIALFTLILYDLFSGAVRQTNY
ncbi:unnamed protein product [Arctia plantaginis]|uniref:SCP domain-containing protein n=1 Tax=Arctia plantaginis TaxID=874455 RepID=A0A8S1AFA6_ARCPL|nr:unnamed protein product [Arctia plantaginis]